MKKLCLVAIVAMFSVMSVNAQNIKFGAKAGLNLSTWTGDGADGADGYTSFHVGGVVEIPISDTFSVQPELIFSDQGSKSDDVKLSVSYLTLPVMGKFYVAEGFSIEAGPQVGFVLSAKAKGDGASVDIDEFIKSIDLGVGVGAGYRLDNGLNFGARYYAGLADVNDVSEGDDIKNSVIQLSVGYFFN